MDCVVEILDQLFPYTHCHILFNPICPRYLSHKVPFGHYFIIACP